VALHSLTLLIAQRLIQETTGLGGAVAIKILSAVVPVGGLGGGLRARRTVDRPRPV
jgi:hypothetical protein